jgi:hypothetical protein
MMIQMMVDGRCEDVRCPKYDDLFFPSTLSENPFTCYCSGATK